MTRIGPKGGVITSTGMTWRNAACSTSKVAIVSDTGDSNRSSLTAAHEISHALGSAHDGKEASKGCPEKDRHLMNPYHEVRKETYSDCSRKSINKFLKNAKALCLFGDVDISQPELGTRLENNLQLKHLRSEACQNLMSDGQSILRIETEAPCQFSCTVRYNETNTGKLADYLLDKDDTPCNNKNPFQKCKKGKCQ
nr:zinc metalloproteinase-disintegrin-like brevilysin H2b [Dermacentor andersoni]